MLQKNEKSSKNRKFDFPFTDVSALLGLTAKTSTQDEQIAAKQ